MKVLVITLNAWNDTGSTGNTISNIFSHADNIEFANLYCRNEKINNRICKKYFRLTEDQIINGLIGKQVGIPFELNEWSVLEKGGYNPLNNGKLGNFLRKYRPNSLMFLREVIWCLPNWKNFQLKKWLHEFNPDIIYMHGHANIYMHRIMEYCKIVTGAKVVLFFGDDMYGRKNKWPIGYCYETLYRHRLFRSIQLASLLFGGSIKLCKEYGSIFNRDFIPMFKQCNLSKLKSKTDTNTPLQIVYAGNLLFGREKTMCDFLQILKKVNEKYKKVKIQLLIYSNTQPSSENIQKLDDRHNSFFMGCKPYSEVCKALNDADMSLFLESFEQENIRKTRLSFSTKIIDCMQSDSAMLAIGPDNIASMEYIIENGIGLTATSLDATFSLLDSVVSAPQLILESIAQKTNFARKNHSATSKQYIEQIKKCYEENIDSTNQS